MARDVYTDYDFKGVGRVRGLLPPVSGADAVNRDYVDGLVASSAPANLNDIGDVVVSAVDKSVLYYDGTTDTFRADSTWTTTNIVDGGNF